MDFAKLMRSRLSLSAVGRWVAPRPVVDHVTLRRFGPVALRSHTSDIAVLCELAGGNYSHLPAGSPAVATVVDLGSNVGLSSRWLHKRYPNARMLCVEPDPGNAATLRENVDGLDATVIEACIGGHRRTVGLETSNGEFAYRMAGEGAIPVITIQDALEQGGFDGQLDVVKCDIEGAEAEVFADCREWIDRVRALVVECHEPYTPAHLARDLEANGGHFRAVFTEGSPAYGVQTVTLYPS